jgi:hypothetical protein
MLRAIIVISFAWPFVVAAAAGAATANWGFGYFTEQGLLALSFVGAPGVMAGVYRLCPASWPDPGRVLLALVVAIPTVFAEVFLAIQVYLSVYVACGGYVASYEGL